MANIQSLFSMKTATIWQTVKIYKIRFRVTEVTLGNACKNKI